jgi:hypothetical protein
LPYQKKFDNVLHHHSWLRQKIWLALEKNNQNFLHCHSWLRQKLWLALKKKKSKFSARQHFTEAENLDGLQEKNFKTFRTTIVA